MTIINAFTLKIMWARGNSLAKDIKLVFNEKTLIFGYHQTHTCEPKINNHCNFHSFHSIPQSKHHLKRTTFTIGTQINASL